MNGWLRREARCFTRRVSFGCWKARSTFYFLQRFTHKPDSDSQCANDTKIWILRCIWTLWMRNKVRTTLYSVSTRFYREVDNLALEPCKAARTRNLELGDNSNFSGRFQIVGAAPFHAALFKKIGIWPAAGGKFGYFGVKSAAWNGSAARKNAICNLLGWSDVTQLKVSGTRGLMLHNLPQDFIPQTRLSWFSALQLTLFLDVKKSNAENGT